MNSNRIVKWMAVAAIVFGGVTILTGSRALFGSLETRADFGNTVPLVLWFNFLAGFVYIATGVGLLLRKRWAVYTSLFVSVSTILVFVAFGVHVNGGDLIPDSRPTGRGDHRPRSQDGHKHQSRFENSFSKEKL